jgi:hypothetical protein
LRKKLRVDRVKKMAIGPGIAGLDMENPGSAEWQKQRYLREVQAIREVKKIDLVE